MDRRVLTLRNGGVGKAVQRDGALKRREDTTLAGRIKIGMAQAGIHSIAELARRMKLNRQTVHRWVDGQGDKLTPEHLFKLSDALQVSARWLALGPPESPVSPRHIDTEADELLQIRDALPQDARDQWLSSGRGLVKILAPTSRANPFTVKTK